MPEKHRCFLEGGASWQFRRLIFFGEGWFGWRVGGRQKDVFWSGGGQGFGGGGVEDGLRVDGKALVGLIRLAFVLVLVSCMRGYPKVFSTMFQLDCPWQMFRKTLFFS